MQNNADYSAAISDGGMEKERWQDDTILLVMTYSKLHRYIPAIRENLDLFWPGRPQTVYASDAPLEGDDVIVQSEGTFLDVLEASIEQIRARFAWAKHVFILLEDICPLGPVEEDRLARAQALLRAKSGKHMNHRWATKCGLHLKYLCVDNPIKMVAEDVVVMSIPHWQHYHNQIPASFWELDHLQDIVAQKRELGYLDPWSFELPAHPVKEDHFVFDGIWPTVPDGFLTKGGINGTALYGKNYPPSPLKTQLRREFCGYDNVIMSFLKYKKSKWQNKHKDPKTTTVEHRRPSQHNA